MKNLNKIAGSFKYDEILESYPDFTLNNYVSYSLFKLNKFDLINSPADIIDFFNWYETNYKINFSVIKILNCLDNIWSEFGYVFTSLKHNTNSFADAFLTSKSVYSFHSKLNVFKKIETEYLCNVDNFKFILQNVYDKTVFNWLLDKFESMLIVFNDTYNDISEIKMFNKCTEITNMFSVNNLCLPLDFYLQISDRIKKTFNLPVLEFDFRILKALTSNRVSLKILQDKRIQNLMSNCFKFLDEHEYYVKNNYEGNYFKNIRESFIKFESVAEFSENNNEDEVFKIFKQTGLITNKTIDLIEEFNINVIQARTKLKINKLYEMEAAAVKNLLNSLKCKTKTNDLTTNELRYVEFI